MQPSSALIGICKSEDARSYANYDESLPQRQHWATSCVLSCSAVTVIRAYSGDNSLGDAEGSLHPRGNPATSMESCSHYIVCDSNGNSA